ncbi:MAG: hypothetical protein ACR2H5_25510 [Ktedonobacteraceae bacterium]
MVQVLDGADAFDAFESFQCPPVVVLQPWMAMVSQATNTAELSALAYAVEAARYELEAFGYYRYAVSWVSYGDTQAIGFALDWLKPMAHSLQRACWHWQQAGKWLTKHGEAHKAALYHPLLTNAQSQDERMAQAGIHLRRYVERLCQEWNLAIPEGMDGIWPTDGNSEPSVSA